MKFLHEKAVLSRGIAWLLDEIAEVVISRRGEAGWGRGLRVSNRGQQARDRQSDRDEQTPDSFRRNNSHQACGLNERRPRPGASTG